MKFKEGKKVSQSVIAFISQLSVEAHTEDFDETHFKAAPLSQRFRNGY